MATFIETGHAKNVANFEQLTSFIAGFGDTYNPSKASIKLAAMQTLLTNAKNVVSVVNSSLPANKHAINAREEAFIPLSKLTTRVLNALKVSDASEQLINDAKTLVRKLQGTRAKEKKTDEELQTLAADGKETKNISASQMGYDNRLDNFDKFIKLIASVPSYKPNEADLKTTALTALYNDLKIKNSAVITAAIPLSNARITRDDVLYKENIGLVDIALDSKLYVKSVFGTSSPQYKQISGLKFTRPR